jgi:hypothetical protein
MAVEIAMTAVRHSKKAYISLVVPDTLKVTAGQCYTNEKPQVFMAKTHGFHKVVRASAGTP